MNRFAVMGSGQAVAASGFISPRSRGWSAFHVAVPALGVSTAVGLAGCAANQRVGSDVVPARAVPESHLAIANAVARFYAAVDARRWNEVAGLMTNPFHVDYSSFGAGAPADLSPDAIIGGWKGILPGFERTHHQLGNLDITIDGEAAVVECYVTATHVIGERVWTVVGSYRNTLVLQAGDWKLSGSQFRFKYQSGATDLPSEAQKRVSGT